MNNIGGSSKYIGFLDECGDHSLENIDPDFPLFVLALVIMERRAYVDEIIPAMGRLKMGYWNHEGVNLHSRDIRKATGPFTFMMDAGKRTRFQDELTLFMQNQPFTLFITGIKKVEHRQRYADRLNPYEVALTYTLERVLHFMKGVNEYQLPLVAEARGKNEDGSLEQAFYKLMTTGTYYRPAQEFKALECPLVFRRKMDNIAGIQIADLCAHPSARNILKPEQTNRAFDAIRGKIYQRDAVRGWKIAP